MRAIVCGGRFYGAPLKSYPSKRAQLDDKARIDRERKIVFAELERLRPTEIAEGGATGADACALRWARRHGVPCQTFRADWDGLGRGAGPARNARMLKEFRPDVVIAFPGDTGTANMRKLADEAGVPIERCPRIETPEQPSGGTNMKAPDMGRTVATTRTMGTLTVRVTAGPEPKREGRTDVPAVLSGRGGK